MATDVASKGLDFPNIQHVINYDMPDDIENYVHRIGRTGRGQAVGVATTMINSKVGALSRYQQTVHAFLHFSFLLMLKFLANRITFFYILLSKVVENPACFKL